MDRDGFAVATFQLQLAARNFSLPEIEIAFGLDGMSEAILRDPENPRWCSGSYFCPRITGARTRA